MMYKCESTRQEIEGPVHQRNRGDDAKCEENSKERDYAEEICMKLVRSVTFKEWRADAF